MFFGFSVFPEKLRLRTSLPQALLLLWVCGGLGNQSQASDGPPELVPALSTSGAANGLLQGDARGAGAMPVSVGAGATSAVLATPSPLRPDVGASDAPRTPLSPLRAPKPEAPGQKASSAIHAPMPYRL